MVISIILHCTTHRINSVGALLKTALSCSELVVAGNCCKSWKLVFDEIDVLQYQLLVLKNAAGAWKLKVGTGLMRM